MKNVCKLSEIPKESLDKIIALISVKIYIQSLYNSLNSLNVTYTHTLNTSHRMKINKTKIRTFYDEFIIFAKKTFHFFDILHKKKLIENWLYTINGAHQMRHFKFF